MAFDMSLTAMFNVVSPCFGVGGMWRHGRSFVRALSRYRPLALYPWETPLPADEVTPEEAAMMAIPWDRHRPTIGIGPIFNMAGLEGSRTIAYIVWDSTRLPFRFRRILRRVDEIWVPSHWGRSVLIDNRIPAERIHVVPEGVDCEQFRPAPAVLPRNRPFRFLCVGKWEARKGTADLVRAYGATFTPNEPVELVLHCDNRFTDVDVAAAVRALAPNCARITLSGTTTDGGMVDLYQSCDAFVLPTKTESWGLPIIEAMACGLPVIVTDYSGYRDYVDDTCGYLIGVDRMVPVRDRVYPWFSGRWAQPDLGHLSQLLRHVFEHRDEARVKGQRARERVVMDWTWDAAARIAHRRLSET